MWSRQKLADIARKRKEALSDVEGALLAFSRTQEMTHEEGIDVKTSEKELEAALDKLEPDAATKLMMLGSVERDEVLRDFIVKMMDHNQSRIEQDLKQVQELTISEKLESPDNERAAPAKKRKRGLRLF
jgi:hypothetical protein